MAGINRFMCIRDCGLKGEKDKCEVRECKGGKTKCDKLSYST